MLACFHCEKGIIYGRSHDHHRGVAGSRWRKRAPKTARIFSPNLQRVDIIIDGNTKEVKLCTKCLKRVKKDMNEGVKPFVTLAHYKAPAEESSKKAEN